MMLFAQPDSVNVFVSRFLARLALLDRGRGQGVRRRSLGDAALRLGQDTVARRRWKHYINAQFLLSLSPLLSLLPPHPG